MMKHDYSRATSALRWLCMGLLLALPGLGAAQNITVNPGALDFGGQTINTSSSPKSVVVNGSSLANDIAVTAPVGFLVSASIGGPYASTATLPQAGGNVQATLYVEFQPSAVQGYTDKVNLSSGAATPASVSVSGTGLSVPVLNASPTTLPDFGSVAVGATSALTATFSVNGQNLQGNVTITLPTGFSIRTGTSPFSTSAVVLTPTAGTLASTPVDVRFTPTAVQQYNSTVSATTPNSGGTPVAQSVSVSGTGTPAHAITITPSTLNFGAATANGSTHTETFTVGGTNLTENIVLTPSKTTIQFRNVTAGGSFSNSRITLMPTNGTVATQTIEVRLVATVPAGAYNEQIAVVSGSTTAAVTVTATNSSGAVSDISVSTSGTDFTFVTRPQTISASKLYMVAATNLLQPLVVSPTGNFAAYFEVSKDNINFFSSISFAPDAQGNVPQQPVYIHFVPGTSAVTVTADISNSSSPAPLTDVSVTGISEPTVRLSRAIGTFPDIVKGTKSAPVTVRLDGFLLTGNLDIRFPADVSVRNPSQVAQYEFSLDNGATYVNTNSFVPDGNGNFTQDLLVRFAPVRVGNANQTLEYHNTSLTGSAYVGLANGNAVSYAIAVEPTAQSTAFVGRATDGRSATVAFDLTNPPTGTSYGASRLVIATSNTSYSKLPTSLFPQDKANFNPGTTINGVYQFGTGSRIESTTNTYVVFSGQSASFTVGNMDPNLYYQFFAFEFNNDNVAGAENYLLPNNAPQVPLPVELVAFTAQRQGPQVNLKWETASEKNSRSFDVERSGDGHQFKGILSKAAQGNSSTRTSYAAVDRQPLPGLSYYRLKQLDADGTSAYSPVVTVQSDGAVALSLYPNPTTGKLTIGLPFALADSVPRVRISDLAGRVVQELTLPANGEVDLSALPAGTYLVSVGGQQVRSRLVKH